MGWVGHNSRKVIFSQSASGHCVCCSPLTPATRAVSRVRLSLLILLSLLLLLLILTLIAVPERTAEDLAEVVLHVQFIFLFLLFLQNKPNLQSMCSAKGVQWNWVMQSVETQKVIENLLRKFVFVQQQVLEAFKGKRSFEAVRNVLSWRAIGPRYRVLHLETYFFQG